MERHSHEALEQMLYGKSLRGLTLSCGIQHKQLRSLATTRGTRAGITPLKWGCPGGHGSSQMFSTQ